MWKVGVFLSAAQKCASTAQCARNCSSTATSWWHPSAATSSTTTASPSGSPREPRFFYTPGVTLDDNTAFKFQPSPGSSLVHERRAKKSCPTCRRATTVERLLRIFLDAAPASTGRQPIDAADLQQKIDDQALRLNTANSELNTLRCGPAPVTSPGPTHWPQPGPIRIYLNWVARTLSLLGGNR